MTQLRRQIAVGVVLVAVACMLTGKAFISSAANNVKSKSPAQGSPDTYHAFGERPGFLSQEQSNDSSTPWASVLSVAVAAGLAVGVLQPAANADDVGGYRNSDSGRAASRRLEKLKKIKAEDAKAQVQAVDAVMTPLQPLPNLSAPSLALPQVGPSSVAATAGIGGLAGSLLILGSAATSNKGQTGSSLLSATEQNGLLTTVENAKLLSTAEKTIRRPLTTLQTSGLAKVIEEKNLLSTAENVLLDSNTTNLLFAASALLLGGAAFLSTTEDDLTALFAGFLLVLGGATSVAGLAISTFFKSSGPRDPSKLTLVKCIEGSGALSYASDVGLLSAAESVAGGRVLATVESSGLLGTAQRARVLSTVESPLVALVEKNLGAPLVVLGLITSFASVLGGLGTFVLVPAGLAVFALGLAVSILTPMK